MTNNLIRTRVLLIFLTLNEGENTRQLINLGCLFFLVKFRTESGHYGDGLSLVINKTLSSLVVLKIIHLHQDIKCLNGQFLVLMNFL